MNYRYSKAWREQTALGQALTNAGCWRNAVPRVGDLFPGITTPMPSPKNICLIEACDTRAVDLLSRYDELVVLWSGGIDSTLVVCKLLQHRSENQTIYITLDDQSKEVGKEYLPRLLALGAKPTEFSRDNLLMLEGNGVCIVTGYHADSILVGEFYDNHNIGENIWNITPTEMIRINSNLSNDISQDQQIKFAERTLENLSPILELMPLEKTAANIGWWLDFTCYWEHDEYELHYRLGLGIPGEEYISFFNTEMFQQWAQQDTRDKAGKDGIHHKHRYIDQINKILRGEFNPPVKAIMEDIGWYRPSLVDQRLLLINEDYSTIVAGVY